MVHKGVTIGAISAGLAAAVTAGAFLLWPTASGSTQGPTNTQTMTVMGNITVRSVYIDRWEDTPGVECYGRDGLRDMKAGAPVVVYDQSDKVIATGQLEAGKWYDACVYAFSIPSVPASPFIQVDVSNHGKVQFSEAQVRANKVMLTLTG